ncbi:MAG: response regulator [Rhodobacteraceae bacterium]|nr:response regulator [Paracoccaceae bacterium]
MAIRLAVLETTASRAVRSLSPMPKSSRWPVKTSFPSAPTTGISAAGKTRIVVTVPSVDTPVCHMETKRFNEEAAKLRDDPPTITCSKSRISRSSRHIKDFEMKLRVPVYETVDIAENGIVAVEKFRAHGYDLILMDLQMPVMNGFDATVRIREKSNVPIIALTATATKSESEKCFEIGMNDYILKPFKPLDLYAKIFE